MFSSAKKRYLVKYSLEHNRTADRLAEMRFLQVLPCLHSRKKKEQHR